MRRLTLVYDPEVLSWSTVRWIVAAPKYVPVDVYSTKHPELPKRMPGVPTSALEGRLTLVDDEGFVWRDGKAELMVMWAVRRLRARALAIGHPSRLPFRRGTLNWFAGGSGDPWTEARSHGVGVAT